MEKSIDNNLTVLLTIKDRQQFTFRWLKYANNTSYPFKVLIADGGKDFIVSEKLSDSRNFPNINYEYFSYPYDQTDREYFSKIMDLISKVKTSYVVFVDDDDFNFPDGLRSCIRFLINNSDYISCGGRMATFSLRPNPNKIYGKGAEFILHPPAHSINQSTSLERVERHFQSYDVTWYDVHRTEVLAKIYSELSTLNPGNLWLAERIASYLTVARGKVKRVSNLMVLRQFNILNSSYADEKKVRGDHFDRMLLKTWSQDFNGFIDSITKAVAEEDGLSCELIRDKFVKGYRRHVAPAIVNCLAAEVGFPRETNFSRIRKMALSLKDDNLVKQMLREIYHKTQDLFLDTALPRPITQSSEFYKEIQPIYNFLISAGEDLKK